MILGRIIKLTDGDSKSLIRATRLTKIFVYDDVLSFFVQCAGMEEEFFLQITVFDHY